MALEKENHIFVLRIYQFNVPLEVLYTTEIDRSNQITDTITYKTLSHILCDCDAIISTI
jgi:hypothetical protein